MGVEDKDAAFVQQHARSTAVYCCCWQADFKQLYEVLRIEDLAALTQTLYP